MPRCPRPISRLSGAARLKRARRKLRSDVLGGGNPAFTYLYEGIVKKKMFGTEAVKSPWEKAKKAPKEKKIAAQGELKKLTPIRTKVATKKPKKRG